jgi:hypothetical protein
MTKSPDIHIKYFLGVFSAGLCPHFVRLTLLLVPLLMSCGDSSTSEFDVHLHKDQKENLALARMALDLNDVLGNCRHCLITSSGTMSCKTWTISLGWSKLFG